MCGSIISDIIDKPLLFLKLDSGRGFSHSLLFIIASVIILYFVTKRNKIIIISFEFGVIMHLLLDFPGIPLLYPFISYEYEILEDPIEYWIKTMMEEPLIIITEILGVIFFIIIIKKNRLYRFQEIIQYLRTISNNLETIQA